MLPSIRLSCRFRHLALSAALAAGVLLPAAPALAGCFGCGYHGGGHGGFALEGLALGALAATMNQPSPQPAYEEAPDPRQRPVRLRQREPQGLASQDVAPEPRRHRKAASKPAPKMAEKPVVKTRTIAAKQTPA